MEPNKAPNGSSEKSHLPHKKTKKVYTSSQEPKPSGSRNIQEPFKLSVVQKYDSEDSTSSSTDSADSWETLESDNSDEFDEFFESDEPLDLSMKSPEDPSNICNRLEESLQVSDVFKIPSVPIWRKRRPDTSRIHKPEGTISAMKKNIRKEELKNETVMLINAINKRQKLFHYREPHSRTKKYDFLDVQSDDDEDKIFYNSEDGAEPHEDYL